MTETKDYKLTPKLARYLTSRKGDQGYKSVVDQHGVEYLVLKVVDCGRMMFLAQAGTDGKVRRTVVSTAYHKYKVMWESLDDIATEIAEQLARRDYSSLSSNDVHRLALGTCGSDGLDPVMELLRRM